MFWTGRDLPFSGLVAERFDVGEYVGPSTHIADLVQANPVRIELSAVVVEVHLRADSRYRSDACRPRVGSAPLPAALPAMLAAPVVPNLDLPRTFEEVFVAGREQEPSVLAVARAAGKDLTDSRIRAREGLFRDRQKLSATIHPERHRLCQRLLSSSPVTPAELEAVRSLASETARAILADRRQALERQIARALTHSRHRTGRRRGPFPDAPSPAAYELVELDTALAISPNLDESGANYRTHVASDPPAPGHNLARAVVEIDSQHQSGFDPGHFNWTTVDFFFGWTADRALQLNAAAFADWIGGYIEYAGWYPFDDCQTWADFWIGMDVIVVDPASGRVAAMGSAQPDGFAKHLDAGPFDFTGKFDDFTYDANSALFVYGLEAGRGQVVFFRVWAELVASTLSNAAALVDFDLAGKEGVGINVPNVFAATFG